MKRILVVLSALFLCLASARPGIAQNSLAEYGKLPLSFEPNLGQTAEPVKFLSHGQGYTLFLTSDAAVLSLEGAVAEFRALPGLSDLRRTRFSARQQNRVTPLRLRLVHPNFRAEISGVNELPGRNNYFIGKDPRAWRTNVPTFAKVKYRSVFPGVDLVYYGNQEGRLEYDFIVAPGANVNRIALVIDDLANRKPGKDLHLDGTGDLIIPMNEGEVRYQKPVAYQIAKNGRKHFVQARYVLKAKNQIGFQLSAYDSTETLIIDPVLVYSTYVVGSATEQGAAIAVDSSGNAYITGLTLSPDFPTTSGAYKTTCGSDAQCNSAYPGSFPDVFVAKLNPTGSALVYSTFIGGSYGDYGNGIAVDASGDAFVTGTAYSPDFPTTAGAFQTFCGPELVLNTYTCQVTPASTCGQDGVDRSDAFVVKLDPNGSHLAYSTFLGGSGNDVGTGIALNAGGEAYISGVTDSQESLAAYPGCSQISGSYGFPTTANAFMPSPGSEPGFGSWPGYLPTAIFARLSVDGSQLLYSTYLGEDPQGAQGVQNATAVAVDGAGDGYITGWTSATAFPITPGAAQPVRAGSVSAPYDAFVTKVDPAQSGVASMVYSTFLGGSGDDFGYGIAVDASGDAYVTGQSGSDASGRLGGTPSSDFPTTPGAFQTTCGGCPYQNNSWVAKLNSTATAFVYSSYLHAVSQFNGTFGTAGYAIAVDSAGRAVVTGVATGDLPTVSPIQATNHGTGNAFITMVNPEGSGLDFSTFLGSSSSDVGHGVAFDPVGNIYVTGTTTGENFPTTSGAFQSTCAKCSSNHSGSVFVAQISAPEPSSEGTSTTVTAPDNPSVFGQPVTLTATVTPTSGPGAPTGTVSFYDDAADIGSGTLVGGQTTLITSALSVGSHSITAVYAGDSNFTGSTSLVLTQTVDPAATTTSVQSSATPSIVNQSVTFTATVSAAAPGSGTPDGSVVFQDGANQLATVPLNSGSAVFTTSALSAGSHSISASYSGSSNFLASSNSLTQQVNYNLNVLYDQSRSVHGGSTFPIKLQLVDANGVDVSSPAIVLHATQITNISGFEGSPQSPGDSNPDSDFRFDSSLGPTGGYIFNLSTSGLASGTYSLNFTAGADPAMHSVTFGVR
jgi:Bacterial Ig-like domain (group 3)/Beta-propeller repeat